MLPSVAGIDTQDDANMGAELEVLRDERDQICGESYPALQRELEQLDAVRKKRLRVADDAKALRMADARARAGQEARIADAEYRAAKSALRAQLLQSAASVRQGGITKRRPRAGSFVKSLERQGMLRLALAPDDVTADLAAVRRGPAPEVTPGGTGDWAPPVHTVHGRLHMNDGGVFEKGDIVAVYPAKPGSLPRFHGELVAVTRKEISIREADTKREPPQTFKVSVTSLKSGRYLLKRDMDGSLRNKKL